MRKLILGLTLIFSVAFMSCTHKVEKPVEVTNDSIQVEMDSTHIVTDSLVIVE